MCACRSGEDCLLITDEYGRVCHCSPVCLCSQCRALLKNVAISALGPGDKRLIGYNDYAKRWCRQRRNSRREHSGNFFSYRDNVRLAYVALTKYITNNHWINQRISCKASKSSGGKVRNDCSVVGGERA